MPSVRLSLLAPWPSYALTLAWAALFAGCDPQMSTAYRGEPLFVTVGSVELTSAEIDGDLRPALAFLNPERAEIRIVDVETEGEFPAEFTMRVYDPPPEETLHPVAGDLGGPRVAIAFITAVTASHPETIQAAQHGETSASPTTCNGEACPCPADGCVREQTRLCTHDSQTCYTETITCPQSDSPDEECTTTYSGDGALKDSPWRTFAGLSQNYMFVYATETLDAGSRGALELGTYDELEQGYNLMAIEPLTLDEQAEQADCMASAEALALERFNRERDTSYDELQILGLGCSMAPADCPDSSPDCAPSPEECPPPATGAETDAYFELVEEASTEQMCLTSSVLARRIADVAAEPITVRIAPGLQPPGQRSDAAPMM